MNQEEKQKPVYFKGLKDRVRTYTFPIRYHLQQNEKIYTAAVFASVMGAGTTLFFYFGLQDTANFAPFRDAISRLDSLESALKAATNFPSSDISAALGDVNKLIENSPALTNEAHRITEYVSLTKDAVVNSDNLKFARTYVDSVKTMINSLRTNGNYWMASAYAILSIPSIWGLVYNLKERLRELKKDRAISQFGKNGDKRETSENITKDKEVCTV